ncbi:hypothetical protein OG252_51630 [Streptomyces sp. NBC_01352]|uniref:hypothetical protein n=1 Tax=unclassified Streptomyces TaxID=2593676 RepID=UPI003864B67C
MVNAGTYWLWQQLAVSDALPDEALPTVIEALCSTSLAPYGVDGRGEERRSKAARGRWWRGDGPRWCCPRRACPCRRSPK